MTNDEKLKHEIYAQDELEARTREVKSLKENLQRKEEELVCTLRRLDECGETCERLSSARDAKELELQAARTDSKNALKYLTKIKENWSAEKDDLDRRVQDMGVRLDEARYAAQNERSNARELERTVAKTAAGAEEERRDANDRIQRLWREVRTKDRVLDQLEGLLADYDAKTLAATVLDFKNKRAAADLGWLRARNRTKEELLEKSLTAIDQQRAMFVDKLNGLKEAGETLACEFRQRDEKIAERAREVGRLRAELKECELQKDTAIDNNNSAVVCYEPPESGSGFPGIDCLPFDGCTPAGPSSAV